MPLLGAARIGLIAVALASLTMSASANIRDTFFITRDVKTAAHPFFGQGSHVGYLVNGVEGATMTFVRDSVYVVNYKAVDDDPEWHFFFTRNPEGGLSQIYDEIEDGRNAPRSTIRVLPTDQTPDTLYYGADTYLWVGGMVLVVDSLPTSSVDNDAFIFGSRSAVIAHPNPVAHYTQLMFQLDQSALVRLEVVDLLGHVVYTGEQSSSRGDCSLMVDASQLSQGIYMYRIIALAGYQRNVMRGSFQVVR